MPDAIQLAAQWAAGEFAGGLAQALEAMSGSRPEHKVEPATSAPASEFRWSQPMSSLPTGFYVGSTDTDVLAVGQNVMLAAGIEDSSPEELRSTFQEVLGQAFSLLGRGITSRLKREVTPADGQTVPDLPADLLWAAVKVILDGKPICIYLGIPRATAEQFIEPVPLAAAAAASASPARPVVPSPAPSSDSRTFDLLLDVELPVSVSFGHAQLPLKDVLKLTTGSIVELSRAVVEPVDIVVNNCVIAKGEVVVVEGNFGVRIQHVVSRSERLRTLQ